MLSEPITMEGKALLVTSLQIIKAGSEDFAIRPAVKQRLAGIKL
jgi:hypothetical protein